jgi:hypothetical protein
MCSGEGFVQTKNIIKKSGNITSITVTVLDIIYRLAFYLEPRLFEDRILSPFSG